MPADLNIGFDTFQKLNDAADEHLDALLDTIMALEKDTGRKCEAEIITWRGMMTKVRATAWIQMLVSLPSLATDHRLQIMTAPYDMMNGFVPQADDKDGSQL